MVRTRTSIAAILRTGIERTSAAHLVIDDEPITVCWSTIPVACTDYLLGNIGHQGPVRQEPDQPPEVWRSSNSTYSAWQPHTEVRCGACGSMVGPWAFVRDGHLDDDEIADLALEVAEHAEWEREQQRRALQASLADDAEDVANRLADGTLERTEVPDLGAMAEPGVGLHGNDEVVAWAFMPNPDGLHGDEIVEVARPIPTSQAS